MRREPEGLGRFYQAEAAVFARYGLRTQQRLVDLPESGIRVRIVETGTGAPTLLLHGFSLTTAHWAPLMAQLPGRRLSSRSICRVMARQTGSASTTPTCGAGSTPP